MQPVILQRTMKRKPKPGLPQRFDRPKYQQRNIIEQMFGWLDESRRIGTRYDKLARGFGAMAMLAYAAAHLLDSDARTEYATAHRAMPEHCAQASSNHLPTADRIFRWHKKWHKNRRHEKNSSIKKSNHR